MIQRPYSLFTLLALMLLNTSFALPTQGAVSVVEARNFFYAPATISILAGDTVRFIWVEGNHPTASVTGAWSTFSLDAANPQFDLVLTATGIYDYRCVIHASIGMIGTITVTASGATCSSTTPPFGLASAPSTNSAVVSWAVLPNTNLYQIRGREVGTIGFRKSVQSSTGLTVPGLMPGTAYEWQVRALCSGTDALTPWSSFETFMTTLMRAADQPTGRAWVSPEGHFLQLPEHLWASPVQARLFDGMGRQRWAGRLHGVGPASIRIPYSGECPGRGVVFIEHGAGLISIPLDVLQP